MPNATPEHPLEIGTQVLDSFVALVRAEAKLLWSHVRIAGTQSLTAFAFTGAAIMLTPVALLVLALSPVLGAWAPAGLVVASIVPVTVLAILCWLLSVRSWRKVFRHGTESKQNRNGGDASPFDLHHPVSSRS